jgi:hypothetical protein
MLQHLSGYMKFSLVHSDNKEVSNERNSSAMFSMTRKLLQLVSYNTERSSDSYSEQGNFYNLFHKTCSVVGPERSVFSCLCPDGRGSSTENADIKYTVWMPAVGGNEGYRLGGGGFVVLVHTTRHFNLYASCHPGDVPEVAAITTLAS